MAPSKTSQHSILKGENSEDSNSKSKPIDIKSDIANVSPSKKGEDSEFTAEEREWNSWPELDPKALFGIAGGFVSFATEKSEADPAAILITLLTRFGVECGPNPFLRVGDAKHRARIFSIIVGASSKARKGTSGKPVLRLFNFNQLFTEYPELDDGEFVTAKQTPGPLSTGEGIIYAVRDPQPEWNVRKQELVINDPGVEDKRLFILDEEFASALSCMKREGNTLSTTIRNAWDSGTLEPLTKTSKIKATGAHIGICMHTTIAELHQKLNEVEAFNGFANRIIWCCAQRKKIVPFPEPMPKRRLRGFQERFLKILQKAQSFDEMHFSNEAKGLWKKIYPELSKENPGLFGGVINRAEAQVCRLSMIYALLDGSDIINQEHLNAALALWDYCEKSARFIFSNREINSWANKILKALESGSKSTTDLHKVFNGKLAGETLDKVLSELIALY